MRPSSPSKSILINGICYLFIYKVNGRRGNPDKPYFVFKTSSTTAKIALSMGKDGQDFMNNVFIVPKADPSGDHENREREDKTNVEFFKTHFNEKLGKVAHDLSINSIQSVGVAILRLLT